ncbi:MAG: DNA translocase FtsK 4TM domain-containing protein [Halanaerobiaceae bacterium]
MANNDKQNKEVIRERRKNEILGIMLNVLGLLLLFSYVSDTTGVAGKYMSRFFLAAFGLGGFVAPIIFITWGIILIYYKSLKLNSRIMGFILTFLSILALIHLYRYHHNLMAKNLLVSGGGYAGALPAWGLSRFFGNFGTYIILSASLLIGCLLWFDVLLRSILIAIKNLIGKLWKSGEEIIPEKVDTYLPEIAASHEKDKQENIADKNNEIDVDEYVIEEDEYEETTDTVLLNKGDESEPEHKIQNYRLPPINLLEKSETGKIKLTNKTQLLEDTLSSFGVKADVTQVSHGPTITRYEVQPATGVKVSKIVNLADDIALSLAAPDVRMEAPIPGKAAIGIEVPHSKNVMVRLREIITTPKFQNSESKLTIALGKGIEGEPIVTDLSRMPHMLVAGATGSGKSVCMSSIISSILFKATPEEVKFILIDPKKVELNHFKGLPHLFSPVVTDPRKASNVLKLVVNEMEERYDLFSDSGTRSIDDYNQKVSGEEKLPYIVVIIDELSDLMMVAASEVEDNICRLAQMSRAAGIHLVIATQRPSVDVITGLIKANIPSRISFAVSSQTDSRTILDMGGAEKLLGKGDMLFNPVNAKKPQRLQGAFIDNKEIKSIVKFIKEQKDAEFEVEFDDMKEVNITSSGQEKDELYEEAVKLVVEYRASISMLQRRLHIGHSRAARLIDTMEEEGIVGPYAGSKPREVLISKSDLPEFINFDPEDKDLSESN